MSRPEPKKIIITEEEARSLVNVLRTNWIPNDQQQIIYNLIRRIEKELEVE